MTVDVLMPDMLVSRILTRILTLMHGHSGSTKAKNQRCVLLASAVGHFLRDIDLDFANIYMVFPSVYKISVRLFG